MIKANGTPPPCGVAIDGRTTSRVRSCPLCGAAQARQLLRTDQRSTTGEQYRIVECVECSLRYTRPFPTREELEDLYKDDYIIYHTVVDTPSATTWRQRAVDFLTSLFVRSLMWDRRRALTGRSPGRILDVGCGNGDFLAFLRRHGWDVYGTEFSAAACEMARARGIKVHQGSLTSSGYPDEYFDVVTLWHVLEHVEYPASELAEARRLLRDDGLLIVEVPNSACLTFRLCKERWFLLEVPQHVQHFTPATLDRILRQAAMCPVYRQNLRCWNFHTDFYSFLNTLRLRERLGIRHFSTDFARASVVSKGLFAAVAFPLSLLSLPYSVLTTLISRNAPIITVAARKVPTLRSS